MATNAASKAMELRRQVRNLDQQAEALEEQAKHSLTTDEASARFNREAEAIRRTILANQERIAVLEGSLQTRLF